jgi:hypothetical protein
VASGSSKGFDIKKAGLRDFSAGLTANVDRHVRPERDAITTVFEAGVPFGRFTASPVVQQLMRDYWLRMDESLTLLKTHLHNAETLVQAATAILANYENADSLTKGEMEDIVRITSHFVNVTESADAQAAANNEATSPLDARPDHGARA